MKKIEELAPATYQNELFHRKTALEQTIKLKTQQLQRTKHLENAGHIRIVPHHNALQFYLITKKGDTAGKYMPRSQNDFAAQVIQYGYNKKVLAALKEELRHIKKLLTFTKKSSAHALIARFSKFRKRLITPITMTDEEYSAQWLSVPYTGKNFDYTSTEFYTSKGQRVRSKSEVIIADALSRHNIPYRYEFPLDLKTQSFPVYPDFCCLNLRTRREFFWEHFGLMDDPEYAATAVSKINNFAASGYLHGKNTIFTFETAAQPMNIKLVEKMIETFLE